MTKKISQTGTGNIALQDIENSTINISQQLGRSAEYQEMLEQLQTLNGYLSYVPAEDENKRLELAKKIEDLTGSISQFRQEVLTLAEMFSRVEIDTERLVRAKGFFDNGEFEKSRNVLIEELSTIFDEQKKLLKIRNDFENETIPKLKNNSEEFMILALSSSRDYQNATRLRDTCDYFEASIQSYESQFNLFSYGHFLAINNRYSAANQRWLKCFERFEPDMSIERKIEVLNNIGLAHANLGEMEFARENFERALLIARGDSVANISNNTKNNLAYVLNNYGLFLTNINENSCAENYLKEARCLREGLLVAEDFESKHNLAVTLLNLGFTFRNGKKYDLAENCYNEALEILDRLIEERPFFVLQQKALITNNLGDLYFWTGELERAERYYNLAFEMLWKLFGIDPFTILPEMVLVSANLAWFYQDEAPNEEKSKEFGFLAIRLALPYLYESALVSEQMLKASAVLKKWGLTEEEIAEKLNELSEQEVH